MTKKLIPCPRKIRRLCLPIIKYRYMKIIDDPIQVRHWIDETYKQMPELFPTDFSSGYRMKDKYISRKQKLKIRRIQLYNKVNYTIRPSFVMPYMTAQVDDVEKGLFLRKFGVPYWALARTFGRNHSFWFRLEMNIGRSSIVGTTVRNTDIPVHVLADEHHQPRDGEMNYIATTVAEGCGDGAAISESAGKAELTAAYDEFREEAQQVQPDYAPKTVNTDGWANTQAAWCALFQNVVILQCFLQAWLNIRQRSKHLKSLFFELSSQVWNAYHSPDKRCFSQRLRRLREWGREKLTGHVLAKVEALCKKRELWKLAFDHPEGHRLIIC